MRSLSPSAARMHLPTTHHLLAFAFAEQPAFSNRHTGRHNHSPLRPPPLYPLAQPNCAPPPPNTHPPLKRMRPSGVRLACVIMPLYSTVSTSSAGASSPSSISPLSVTVPAGRFGALRAPAPPPPPPPPLGAACVFLARGCFLCCWGAGWREGRRERERGESETR